MKRTIITTLLAVCLIMTSCSTTTTSATRKIDKVEVGMSKQDIRKLLGTPIFKNADDMVEQWAYRKIIGDILQPEEAIFIVTFNSDGNVEEYRTMKPLEFRMLHPHFNL